MGRALQLQMLEAELQDHIDSIPWISLSLPSAAAVSIDTLERCQPRAVTGPGVGSTHRSRPAAGSRGLVQYHMPG